MKIVNFGCGPNPFPGALNIDGSPTVLLARLPFAASVFGSRRNFIAITRKHQVRFGIARKLAFPEASLDGFYCSHTLEHMPRAECASLLRRIHGWLHSQGVLRVVLPDLRLYCLKYIARQYHVDQFLEALNFPIDDVPWWRTALGYHHHRWMYDCVSFSEMLHGAGFSEVRAWEYGKGWLQELYQMDLPEHSEESFYVEARP